LLLGSILAAAALLLTPQIVAAGTLSLLFLLVFCEEALERWLFYEARLNP
jgi:DMSO reductase anchor subunit